MNQKFLVAHLSGIKNALKSARTTVELELVPVEIVNKFCIAQDALETAIDYLKDSRKAPTIEDRKAFIRFCGEELERARYNLKAAMVLIDNENLEPAIEGLLLAQCEYFLTKLITSPSIV